MTLGKRKRDDERDVVEYYDAIFNCPSLTNTYFPQEALDEAKYKILSGTRTIVPRESYIKQQLRVFLESICKNKGIHVVGYSGKKLSKKICKALDKVNNISDDDSSVMQELPTVISPLEIFSAPLELSPLVKKISAEEEFFQAILQNPVSPEQIIRHHDHNQVHDLPIFNWYTESPPMNNGHVRNLNFINRCLTLKSNDEGVQVRAAIYFTINLTARICEIEMLGVDQKFQGRQYGSILLHSAIIIACLYGISNIELASSFAGLSLYLGNGFVPADSSLTISEFRENDEPDLELSLNDAASLKKLSQKMSHICDPQVVLQQSFKKIQEGMATLMKLSASASNPSPNPRVVQRHFELYQKFKSEFKISDQESLKAEEEYFAKRQKPTPNGVKS